MIVNLILVTVVVVVEKMTEVACVVIVVIVVIVIMLMFVMLMLQIVALVGDVKNLTRQVLGDWIFRIVMDHLDEVRTSEHTKKGLMLLLSHFLFYHHCKTVFIPVFSSPSPYLIPIHLVIIH